MNLVFSKEYRDIFIAMRDGKKRIETRAATPKYRTIQAGQTISFSWGDESFERKVSKVTHFASIEALLKVYRPSDINPELTTTEEIISMYHGFRNYEEKLKKFGLLAFEF